MSYEATKNRIFDRAELRLTTNFAEINNQILQSIMEVVNSLDVSDGFVSESERNNRIRGQINDIVKRSVNQSDYTSNVNQYLKSFNEVAEEDIKFHTNRNRLSGVGQVVNTAKRRVINLTTNQLVGSGMDKAFTIPVSDALEQYITTGATKKSIEESLRSFILTDKSKQGLLERYAGQIAHDSIMQFDGNVQQKVQEEYKLNAIAYIGSLIQDSRPQCQRWVNKFNGVIKRDELASEIAWAEANGSGWIQGTNEQTFLSHRGGYRCRHIATPINV